ncbi:MAG: peptide ABC transporter permease, partial [Pseudomonadota bacterium]
MFNFLLRRLGLLLPTFIGVTIASFTFIRLLPGDPITLLAGERGVSEDRYLELQAQ